jgi:fibronectin type 3 domain-containing protein
MVRPVGRLGRQFAFVPAVVGTDFRAFLGTVTFNSVALTWEGTTGGRFRIYRWTPSSAGLLATVTGNTYTDTTALANTAYSYSIVELDGSNNEVAFSNEIGVTTPVAPTPDPDPTPGDTVAPTDPAISAFAFAAGGTFVVQVTVTSSFDAGGIDRYSISLNDQFNRTITPAQFFGDFATFTLGPGDGLVEGREYVITVTAVDLAGNASQTVGTTFTTPTLSTPFLVTTLGTATPAVIASVNNLDTAEFLGSVGGAGIGGTADSGAFAYTPAPADDNFSITGRVASLFGGNPHGGIAIRESIAAGSPMVSFTVASDGASLRTRATANANAVGQSISVTPAVWLRLEYAAGAITASTSPDGVTWTVRGTTSLTFNGVPLVGFVFASRANGTATTAAFDNFRRVLTPPDTAAPSVPTLSATTTGTSSIRLDWTASTDAASGVREYRLTRNTVPIATVPFGVTTYTDTGLIAGTAYTYGIQAVDNAGNVSAEDTEIATTTAVAVDLGTWLPIPEIVVPASTTVVVDLAPYYVAPSGKKLDSLAISSADENANSVTAAYPSGASGSIIDNTKIELVGGATTGVIDDLHVVPTISAISSSGGPGDTETDWATRSGGAGVFLANNFTQYANQAALKSAGLYDQVAFSPGVDSECDLYTSGTVPILSGGKCLRLRTFSTAERNGGVWRVPAWPGARNGFYVQVQIALNRAARAWRRTGTDGQVKFMNLGQVGTGQLTLTMFRHAGFPTLMLNGSTALERVVSASGSYPGDRYYQTAIDAGTPAVTSLSTGNARYGVSWRLYSSSSPRFSAPYIGTNAASNYMDARSFTFPDPEAVAAGSRPFVQDDWFVVEIYYNAPGQFRLWGAPRGTAPIRLAGDWTPSTGSLSVTSLGNSTVSQVELMNYDTAADPEPGYRPTFETYFAEFIASTNWIPFPGHLAGTEP